MAVAIGRHRKEVRTGLHMNFLFFLMSMVVLVVVGISMWKDTHPEWLAYQKKFVDLEHGVLVSKRADLLRQIEHPNYDQDYQVARKAYLESKTKYDAATAALESTEADLEEGENRLQAGTNEEGDTSSAPVVKAAQTEAKASKASKNELDQLDNEFDSTKSGNAPVPPKSGTPKGSAAPTSKKELDDMDKEFADSGSTKKSAVPTPAPKGSKPTSDEMAQLDNEFKDSDASSKAATSPATKNVAPKTAATSDDAELANLDSEFKDSDKGKPDSSHGAKVAVAAQASTTAAYAEANLAVDQPGAEARLEAAQRDLLTARRTHNREMIGLPADASLKRKLSDGRLKEADQSLTVAQTDVEFEAAKLLVKNAALVAQWAVDVKLLDDLTTKGQLKSEPTAHVKLLQDSRSKLDTHVSDLKRDLRLVEGRLSRNTTSGPEVEQIYVDRLGAIDRCTTCHKAVEQPGFEKVAEPFRTHSTELLRWHPVERFGCASCHGGWGNALQKGEAHGDIIGKGRPLLVGDQVQSSCGKCHGETRQLAGEETYLAGAKLFKGSGCLGCHKVELNQPTANAGPSVKILQTTLPKAGPDLDRVSEKIKPDWLVGWLRNPQSHSLDARMPNLGLEKTQAIDIATYLMTQRPNVGSNVPAGASALVQQRIAQGQRLLENLGCRGCHVVKGEGMAVGPELTNIRTKVNPQWLYGWIANPKDFFPNSRMPVFNLSREQSMMIGDYLLSIGSEKPAPEDINPNLADLQAKNLGAKLIAERGCAGCHDIKGFDRISAPELTRVGDKTADVLEFGNAKNVKRNLYDYVFTKITDPRSFDTDKFRGKMPKFGLAPDDARTIAVYLMSLSTQELPPEYTRDLQEQGSPLLAGRRVFAQHDCTACHRIAGEGGKVGPDLTREGEMVRPGWMFEFLKQPIRIRWWADARMPNYHMTDAEATTLTEFFMSLSNQPAPYEYTPPDQKIFPLATLGEKYFADLKCQSCHPLAGKQGVAGGDTKKLGPDLGMAPNRLKKDWMIRFLKDPQAFSPGTQMPTFGKPEDQYQAVVDFLMKQRTP